jgi:hypothetical protein
MARKDTNRNHHNQPQTEVRARPIAAVAAAHPPTAAAALDSRPNDAATPEALYGRVQTPTLLFLVSLY